MSPAVSEVFHDLVLILRLLCNYVSWGENVSLLYRTVENGYLSIKVCLDNACKLQVMEAEFRRRKIHSKVEGKGSGIEDIASNSVDGENDSDDGKLPSQREESLCENHDIDNTNRNEGLESYVESSYSSLIDGNDIEDTRRVNNGKITSPIDFNSDAESEVKLYDLKRKEIQKSLSENKDDMKQLKKFAITEGGLVCDDIRKKVWPRLLEIDKTTVTPCPSEKELKDHKEYQQVVLDVNRSLKRFPPGIPGEQRIVLQDQLTRLILRVIIKYPHLNYYQGYHDVAVTFLLVVGEDVAFQIMETLSTKHMREFMEPTMDRTTYLLNYVYPLIKRQNPRLHDFMEKSGVGTMFCLPWLITWYGHVLNQYRHVVRLYDYFLASPPLMALYLAAAIVIHRQDEVLASECDMACLHSLLSQVPDDLPFESLLKEATRLYEEFPPESIEAEVEEISQRNLHMRHEEELALQRRRRLRPGIQGALVPMLMDRFLPAWRFPHRQQYIRLLAFTATVVVGFYAYFRTAEAVVIQTEVSR